ncbi:cell division initiation protein [Microbacterium sp. LjRoot45]|uniref:cell division initiation protein n=1 Tax=Microbacterium sp. LjRoot45 TaxID=3342329 RepID=UPI003ECFAE87
MPDLQTSPGDENSPFDDLIRAQEGGGDATFTTAFRGYDKGEVESAIAELTTRLRVQGEELSQLKDRYRRAVASAKAQNQAQSQGSKRVEELEAELAVATAKASNAEEQVQTLTEELLGASGESANRRQFEEVLHVAEEQASLLIKNASVQADRLLAAANEEIQNRRKEAQADADAIIARAEHDAQQARVRIDTELTAHAAQLERERAHAAEKVAQAEQEAATIRTESEKGAAALRSLVARETEQARAEAEEAVRELRMRALEFEESLTRRQDDAQQEFLMLHNQAVAHAERITKDANDQVAASLEHSQRITAKADDFDRLMRAQASQIEADAHLKAREQLDRARVKAQKIIETVTAHSDSVLRDAEDRTRQLRWQQHQLTSFMSEVRELMRGEASAAGESAPVEETDADADSSSDASDGAVPDEVAEAELDDAIESVTAVERR